MNWWQIALTCASGWWVGWKTIGTLLREMIDPPWIVKVRSGSHGRQATAVVCAVKKWRDGDYGKNHVEVGSIKLDDEDFDEKILDLRDRAQAAVKQLNRLSA